MTRGVTYSHRAKKDLEDIWRHTCRTWSRDQADTYLGEMRGTLDLLAEQPEIAPLRRDLTPTVRAFPFRSHMILFRDRQDGIEVVRVVHARSNWQKRPEN